MIHAWSLYVYLKYISFYCSYVIAEDKAKLQELIKSGKCEEGKRLTSVPTKFLHSLSESSDVEENRNKASLSSNIKNKVSM